MDNTCTSPGYDIVSRRRLAHLRLAEYIYHPHFVNPLHSHDTDHFYFVINGSCSETDRRETFRADPGTLVFHPAGDKHHNVTSPEGLRVFGIEVEDPWRERVQTHRALPARPYHLQGGTPTVLALRLFREFSEPDGLSSLAIEALMIELLVEVARMPASASECRLPRWLRRVRDRLDSQFAEGITLDQIARTADVHPVYLARAFRSHYRCTIGEYVRRQRIHHACRLIATSDCSLADIALEVGYSDQAHFSRAFKRIMGVSPGEYRASAQEG